MQTQALRELNLDELTIVSGGVKWSCTVKATSDGKQEISCTVSGEF